MITVGITTSADRVSSYVLEVGNSVVDKTHSAGNLDCFVSAML
jgi:hypothetical protein